MRTTRRQLLNELTRASGIAMGCGIAAVVAPPARGNERPLAQDRRSFRGSRPGEERNVDGITLCWCPPGRFAMGSPASEPGRRPDETQVEVTLTRGFWTAKHEATQGQWRRVFGTFPDRPPSAEFGEGDDFPAYWINFDEAEAFCARLTQSARRSAAVPEGWAFTLPTEAQWEYACRAGTSTLSSFGEVLGQEQANVGIETTDRALRARGSAKKVGSYAANAWGIRDMHGNVWEWCRDFYHAQLPGGTDPDLYASRGVQNRDGTYSRVRRGGAWIEPPSFCRSATRLRYEPHRRSDHIGFRVFVVERTSGR
jgi:formylglycine-generating enzyme required for sulfatase activity